MSGKKTKTHHGLCAVVPTAAVEPLANLIVNTVPRAARLFDYFGYKRSFAFDFLHFTGFIVHFFAFC
jgi:hypothetical protein